ncbi:CoA transferase [Streptomyces sp. NPDC002788]
MERGALKDCGSRTSPGFRPDRTRRTAGQGRVDHWSAVLPAAGVPAGPVNTLGEAFAFADRLGLPGIVTVTGAGGGAECPQVAGPVTLSAPPAHYVLPPPALGEHTADTFGEATRRTPGVSDSA